MVMKESYESQEIQNSPVDLNVDVEDKFRISMTMLKRLKRKRLSPLHDKELEMIKQALIRTNGRRKMLLKNLVYQKEHYIEKLNNTTLGDISEF